MLLIPALLVSAWFLLPAIAYESHTQISAAYPVWRLTLRATMYLVSTQNRFAVSRVTAIGGSEFVLSLPILAMAWTLVSILICWRGGLRGAWVKVLLICAALAALMTVVMTHAGLMLALPQPFAILQFAYRLESYVMLGVSGAVLAALLVLRKDGTDRLRLWAWMLAPILIVSVAGAIVQSSAYPRDGSRESVLKSRIRSEFTPRVLVDYTDGALPHLVAPNATPTEVVFPPEAIRDDRISKVVHLRPGQLVYSNIGGGPELVHVSGAKIVGVDPSDNDVLEIEPARGSSKRSAVQRGLAATEVLTLSTADGLPVVLGRLLSLLAIVFLVAMFVVLAVRRFSWWSTDRGARGLGAGDPT